MNFEDIELWIRSGLLNCVYKDTKEENLTMNSYKIQNRNKHKNITYRILPQNNENFYICFRIRRDERLRFLYPAELPCVCMYEILLSLPVAGVCTLQCFSCFHV
jgi:hypothetical protein